MFTYDCFYYLLIDLLQTFVSKEFTALYSLSDFMNKDLQRREQAMQSPLQGEKSSVEKHRVGVLLSAKWRRERNRLVEGIFKAFALLSNSKPGGFLPSSLRKGVGAEC